MTRPALKAVLLAGLVPMTGLPAACAAKHPPPAIAGVTPASIDPLEVPPDFSVDLTVWADVNARGRGAARAQPPVQPGRFILFCDGSLHWSGRVEHPEDERPPLRRVLRRADMAAIWTLIRQLGMDDAANATPPVNVHLIEPPPGQVLYLAVLTGDGRRWAVQRQTPARDEPDPAMRSLVERLSELAWASPAGTTPTAPRRYDFGPDPYARYRR